MDGTHTFMYIHEFQEWIVGSINVDNQKVHEILHLTESCFDGDLSQRVLFALLEALYNQAGRLEMSHSWSYWKEGREGDGIDCRSIVPHNSSDIFSPKDPWNEQGSFVIRHIGMFFLI